MIFQYFLYLIENHVLFQTLYSDDFLEENGLNAVKSATTVNSTVPILVVRVPTLKTIGFVYLSCFMENSFCINEKWCKRV